MRIARKRPRHPLWSVRTVTAAVLVVIGISVLVAAMIPDLNIFLRMELALGIVAISIFWLMASGLYRGARVKKNDLPPQRVGNIVSPGEGLDMVATVTAEGLPFADCGGGCLGALFVSILWIVVSILGTLLIWAMPQLGGSVIVAFIFDVSWIVSRPLRQVFAHSRQCQGKLAPSIAWAMLYTTLYSAWLFALLLVGSWIIARS